MARNKPQELHPIGTELIYPVLHTVTWTSNTSEIGPVSWWYKVTGHVLTPDWPGDLEQTWKEVLQPIGGAQDYYVV